MKLSLNSVNQNIALQISSFTTQVTLLRLLPSTQFNRLGTHVFCQFPGKDHCSAGSASSDEGSAQSGY